MRTRVPIEILLDHLETGLSIDEFLYEYPLIRKSEVIQVLEMAGKLFSSKDIQGCYLMKAFRENKP